MRIVSLAPSNTEILFELGLGDAVIGTTALCDYPEKAIEKPSVGGWTNLDTSKVEELDPDIVLASDDLQDDLVSELKDTSFIVEQFKPHTLEQVFDSIIEIGEIFGREDEAYKIVERMKNEISEIDLDGKRIYCEEWMDPPMVSGNWIPGLIEEANGEYIIEEGIRSRKIETSEIVDFNPEIIVLNVCGAGKNFDIDIITERENWSSITAVKEENIFVVDDALLNRPGPRLTEGLKRIESET